MMQQGPFAPQPQSFDAQQQQQFGGPPQPPTPASAITAPSPAPGQDDHADQSGASAKGKNRKRSRKSNATAAATPAGKKQAKGKGDKDGSESVDGSAFERSRQNSMREATPAKGSVDGPGGSAPSSVPNGSLTPRTAMKMLQHGNLNPIQQAAALAAVRSSSGGGAAGAGGDVPGIKTEDQKDGGAAAATSTPVEYPPNKFKVEYMPTRRDVHTHGGWDLDLIEAELGPMTKGAGKNPRSMRELGSVDVTALVLSLRSKMETEVTYALNNLLILSSGSGVRPETFGIELALCGDLWEELLELLKESAFGEEGKDAAEEAESPHTTLFDLKDKETHRDWVSRALEDEETAQAWRRQDRGGAGRSQSEPDLSRSIAFDAEEQDLDADARLLEELNEDELDGQGYRSAQGVEEGQRRRAEVSLTILDILRNFALMPENETYLARDRETMIVLGRLVSREQRQLLKVFTPRELLRVRKEVLAIVSNLTGEAMNLSQLPVETVGSLFDLFCSFMLDGSDIQDLAGFLFTEAPPPPGVPPHLAPRQPPIPWAARVPHYAAMALDGFSRFAQPDRNREMLSKLLSDETVMELCMQLVRMLPTSELDFNLFRTEARLAYTEHVAMCLYDVVFLANTKIKQRLRNNTAGWVSCIFRVIKRTSRQSNGPPHQIQNFMQNPFCPLIYRLVETLRLVDEARDMFDTRSMLSFAGGAGRGGDDGGSLKSSSSAGSALLAADEEDVLHLLAIPNVDPVVADHLRAMIAF